MRNTNGSRLLWCDREYAHRSNGRSGGAPASVGVAAYGALDHTQHANAFSSPERGHSLDWPEYHSGPISRGGAGGDYSERSRGAFLFLGRRRLDCSIVSNSFETAVEPGAPKTRWATASGS